MACPLMRVLLLATATLSVIACSDNGTTLGSMAQAGTTSRGGGGGTEPESGTSGSAGSGAGDVAQAGGPSGGISNGGAGGMPDAGEGADLAAGAAGAAGALGCTVVGDCKSLIQNYTSRLSAARACVPSLMPEPQCPDQIVDACGCPISVVSSGTLEVQCYLEAREQLQERGCAACPIVPECPVPTGQCGGPVASPMCL